MTTDPAAVARKLEVGRNELDDRLGIQIVEASAERVVATMPVEGNTQVYGNLHGGASCVLAESVGSCAAAVQAGPGRMALGIELNVSHHRTVDAGVLTAVARKASAGRTLATYDVVITDERERRICTARVTSLLRDRPDQATAPPPPAV
jgi:1,4-dihydroxy-2-naphthoyl-CoA hydrolase